jgi:hypothetical protein
MPDSVDDMDNLARLMALELLIRDMLIARYLGASDPVEAARAHRQYMRAILGSVALPDLADASLSELAIGAVGDKIDDLLEQAGAVVANILDQKSRS